MAKARKLPSGAWRVQIYIGKDPITGKSKYESITGSTKKEAERKAAFRQLEIEEERSANSSGWTLEFAMSQYIEAKRPFVSPSTARGYEKIKDFAFSSIMHIPINKLTSDMINDAVVEEMKRPVSRFKSGKSISPKTVKNEVGFLRAVLRKYLPSRHFEIQTPTVQYAPKDYPPPWLVWDAIKQKDDAVLELSVLLAMWLTLSQSEIMGLTKDSISPDGEYITIRGTQLHIDGITYDRDYGKTTTRLRKHHIPETIKGLLEKVLAESKSEKIIPISRDALYKRFRRTMIKAKQKAKDDPENKLTDGQLDQLYDISFHDLRHISQTVATNLGISEQVMMARGGWSSPSIMKRVYTEIFTGQRQEADAIIDSYFEAELGKTGKKEEKTKESWEQYLKDQEGSGKTLEEIMTEFLKS